MDSDATQLAPKAHDRHLIRRILYCQCCTVRQTCITLNKSLEVLRYKKPSLAAPEPWKSFWADTCPNNLKDVCSDVKKTSRFPNTHLVRLSDGDRRRRAESRGQPWAVVSGGDPHAPPTSTAPSAGIQGVGWTVALTDGLGLSTAHLPCARVLPVHILNGPVARAGELEQGVG